MITLKNTIENIEEGQKASYGLRFIPVGLLIVLSGLYLLSSMDCRSLNCGPNNNQLAASLGGITLFLLGVFITYLNLWDLTWSDKTISFRSRLGRQIKAHFDDIQNYGYNTIGQYYWVEFAGKPKLYFNRYVSNLKPLIDKIEKETLRVQPHLSYLPAIREHTTESRNCGCVNCLGIFPVSSIEKWDYATPPYVHGQDLAHCPNCAQPDGVVADMSLVIMSKDSLSKLANASNEYTDKPNYSAHQSIRVATS